MAANYVHDVYRHIPGGAQNLTVNSTAAVSTSSVASQTRFVRIMPMLATSTQPPGGIFYAISEVGATAITSATGTYCPALFEHIVKCNPGQMVQALADGLTVTNVSITQETD